MRGSWDDDGLVPLYQPFETELRGFNRRQVLEHLESLDGRIVLISADRDAALTQVTELSKVLNHLRLESELLEYLRQEADQATARVERVLATPMAQASGRIQRIMRLVEEEAADLKAQTEAEIATMVARAEADIAELRARADDEIAKLRAQASREARLLIDHARRQCDQFERDSAARRKAAEAAAVQEIAHRESAASARIRDSELRAFASLHLVLQVVGEQLSTRVGALERDEATAHSGTIEHAAPPAPPVPDPPPIPVQSPIPVQRSAQDGTMHLPNARVEDSRLPDTSR